MQKGTGDLWSEGNSPGARVKGLTVGRAVIEGGRGGHRSTVPFASPCHARVAALYNVRIPQVYEDEGQPMQAPPDGHQAATPNPNDRNWPEARPSDPIVPDMDPEEGMRKWARAKATREAAALMGVKEKAVRDAEYVRLHDKELFNLVLTGEIHLDDALEVLAGNETLEQARELLPIRNKLDEIHELAEKDPRVLAGLEKFIAHLRSRLPAQPSEDSS